MESPCTILMSCNSAHRNIGKHKTNNSTTKTKTSPKDYPIYKSQPAKLCLSLTRLLLALAPCLRTSRVLQVSSQFTFFFKKKRLVDTTFTTLAFFLVSAWDYQIDLGDAVCTISFYLVHRCT